jgi:hypothetical protein
LRGGGATLCGRQVQQPPLLLRLLPLLVPPGPLERRVERYGILGGDDVAERAAATIGDISLSR